MCILWIDIMQGPQSGSKRTFLNRMLLYRAGIATSICCPPIKQKNLKNKQTNKPHWRCWAEADTVHRVSPLPLKYQICGMCTWSSAGTRKWAGPAGPLGLAPRTQSPPDQTSKRLHQRTDPSETFDLKKERTTTSVWNLLDLQYVHA